MRVLRAGGVVAAWLMMVGCASAPPKAVACATPAPSPAEQRARKVEKLLSEGRALARQREYDAAESRLQDVLREGYGFGSPWVGLRADALSELARCQLAQQRAADARGTVEQALAGLKPSGLLDDQRISELETTRGEAFVTELEPRLAATSFEAAAQASARHQHELAPALVSISLRLAETLQAVGRRQDARLSLERAREAAKQPAVGAALALRFVQALAAAYDAVGEPARADALLTEFGIARPKLTTAVEAAEPAPVTGDASREVASMQADFRACYRASLQDNGDVAGRVALVLNIGADGHVSSAKAQGSGLPASAVDCLLRRAALAHFEPPRGGSAVITVPVTFVKQEND